MRSSSYCTHLSSGALIVSRKSGEYKLERLHARTSSGSCKLDCLSSRPWVGVCKLVCQRARNMPQSSDMCDRRVQARAHTSSRQRAFQLVCAQMRPRSNSGAFELLRHVRSQAVKLTSMGTFKLARKRTQTCTIGAFKLGRMQAHVNWRV